MDAAPSGHARTPFLDGLRGVSVLAVITWHVQDGQPYRALNGQNGVLVFFVLSGFLITTLALREEDRLGRLDLRAFWRRRFWRLCPLYYLALAVVALALLGLDLGQGQEEFRRALPYYALYVQEFPGLYRHELVPFGLTWSLGIEEKFYLVWPVVAFVLLRARRTWRLPAAAVLLAASLSTEALLPRGWAAVLVPYSHILLGCLVALCNQRWPRQVGRAAVLVPAALLVAVVLWFVPLRGAAQVLFTLPVAVLVAGMSHDTTSRTARALSWRPLAWIGVVSYAVYLFHTLALNVVEAASPVRLPAALLLVLGTLVALAVAGLLHHTVEVPFIRYGRRRPTRRARTETPLSSPVG